MSQSAMTGVSNLESTAAMRNAPSTSATRRETPAMTGADQNQGAVIGVSLSENAVTTLAMIGVTVIAITAACGISAEAAQLERRERMKRRLISLSQLWSKLMR